DFSTKKKVWVPEEAPSGYKNAPSSAGDPAAYLYDEPSVPPTQTKMFESVVVVPATGEVLGALRWGVSWAKGRGIVLGGESQDCIDAPSADFGIALSRFYATPKTVDMKITKPTGEEHYAALLDGFIANEATLTAAHKKQLHPVVEQLKEFPTLSAAAGGFADQSEKDPFGISEERAAKVKSYLTEQGVQKDRIESAGFGAAWVRFTPSAKENRNRRVQILLHF
ncbi:MAG: OmpA family protein, partial [Acidobacteriota bacterium]